MREQIAHCHRHKSRYLPWSWCFWVFLGTRTLSAVCQLSCNPSMPKTRLVRRFDPFSNFALNNWSITYCCFALNKAVREKMMCVNEFVRTAKLPKELSHQVQDFFEFKLSRLQHSVLISGNYNVDEVSLWPFYPLVFNPSMFLSMVTFEWFCQLLDELGSGLKTEVLVYMDRWVYANSNTFE